jgi:hypothetical protein
MLKIVLRCHLRGSQLELVELLDGVILEAESLRLAEEEWEPALEEEENKSSKERSWKGEELLK